MPQKTQRYRTAISRSDLSRPIRLALEDELIQTGTSVFDFGCGRGDDLKGLSKQDIAARGWDPNFRPDAAKEPADAVNIGYVVNVIEDPRERQQTLRTAWSLANKILIVAARLTGERFPTRLTPFADGWLTTRNTFQKFYEQEELRAWIDNTLDESSVAAGPGVFYVFRDESLKQGFLAARMRRRRVAVPRRRISDELFEQHQELLQPLMDFYAARGRLPVVEELSNSPEIEADFGSLKRAFRVVLWATNETDWEEIRRRRSDDLKAYVALSRFGGRPKFSKLPHDVRLDVKAFFSNYTNACKEADKLLFSIADLEEIDKAALSSPVGKTTRSSLYVHASSVADLPPILRVYEGGARALTGQVEEANIVKLSRFEPKVSYLSYPDFEKDPHPVLAQSISVNLHTFHVKYRYYDKETNPPILHRKETLVSEDHELRSKFERLTKQEETWGLYDSGEPIGRKRDWLNLLIRRGATHRGHRIVRS